MKKGTKVSWTITGVAGKHYGVTISDEENGKVQVSVDGGTFAYIPVDYHVVIHCTVTWLTVEK